MSNQRTHYVTTTDGVTIGGTVHGEGPPLVFLPGVVGDGDLDWQGVLPHLTDRFTCHLLSNRGRGLSGDHPDHSIGRFVEDVIAYLDSIGEPTGIVGWSLGAAMSLMAAAQSDAVNAIAPFEPGVMSLADGQEQATMGGAIARTGELAGQGKLVAAVSAFLDGVFNEEEIAAAENAGYCESAGRHVPHLLQFFQQAMESGLPTVAEDAAVVGAISVPVLVLKGADTKPFFAESARFVAEHAPNAQVHEIPGAGHAAPLTHPEALAKALTEFFSTAQQPA